MDRQNVLLGGAYPNIDNTPDNIEARDNVAIGYQSMNALKNAQGNTALGLSALSENISGKYNTAIGYNAGSTLQADYNTYIGAEQVKRHQAQEIPQLATKQVIIILVV